MKGRLMVQDHRGYRVCSALRRAASALRTRQERGVYDARDAGRNIWKEAAESGQARGQKPHTQAAGPSLEPKQ